MTQLPVYIDIKHVELSHDKLEQAFLEKWRVDGMAEHKTDSIAVLVNRYDGARPHIVNTALGHEVGHSEFMRAITYEECTALHTALFTWEVSAWLKWAGSAHVLPISQVRGQFILDCLNTYRRGCAVSDDEWNTARAMVESWTAYPDRLAEYQPLEPPINAQPPKGCGFGGGFVPMPAVGPSSDPQPPTQPDDMPMPQPPTDSPSVDRTARDEWLLTGDGMQAAATSESTLQRELLKRGWDMEALPPMTIALIGK